MFFPVLPLLPSLLLCFSLPCFSLHSVSPFGSFLVWVILAKEKERVTCLENHWNWDPHAEAFGGGPQWMKLQSLSHTSVFSLVQKFDITCLSSNFWSRLKWLSKNIPGEFYEWLPHNASCYGLGRWNMCHWWKNDRNLWFHRVVCHVFTVHLVHPGWSKLCPAFALWTASWLLSWILGKRERAGQNLLPV